MEETPLNILKNLYNNSIDLDSAIDNLLTLIESSTRIKLRISGIEALYQLQEQSFNFDSKSEKIFRLFEHLLISDSSEVIRSAAATYLIQNFKDRAFHPMIWVLHHENAPETLKIVIKFIMRYISRATKIDQNFYSRFINEIQDLDFKLAIQDNLGMDYKIDRIKDLLLNYFCLIYLKKIYWRIKYQLENNRIVSLDFTFKEVISVPEPIKYITSLKTLILKYNQLTHLPSWIQNLNSLTTLNLNINNITELPSSIGLLKNLEKLTLWKNDLTYIPESVSNLQNLKVLNLRLNKLRSLPPKIGNLKNLKTLNLHDNELNSLPKSMMYLNSLINLNLSWNSLSSIPDSITKLKALRYLDLERNQLTHLPLDLSDLESLISLNLSDNKIQNIPPKILFPRNLKSLNLSRNELKILPNELLKLRKLKELYIGQNNFEELPKCLEILEQKGIQIIN